MSNVLASSSLFKLALVQIGAGFDKSKNLSHAKAKILEAAKNGAQVVVLPECFNSPYGTKYFPEYAENLEGGESVKMLSDAAKEGNVYLIGGSIPEKEESTGKIYNTLTAYDPFGKMIAKHRKVHLFDIDITGQIRFKESDVLSEGDWLTHIETKYGKLGVGICYDMRFPEMAMIAARKGCLAMIYPGAFNMTTGPLHWELLQRARAVDNQMYVAACGPARDVNADYVAWGHSTIVDPKGEVIATCDEKETIIYADIDPANVQTYRKYLPLYDQRRFDIYGDVAETVVVHKDGTVTKKV
ncbi:carbon-nitrogen hydrolase [Cokeromyces recurvatus]|uniref:carbon-nitrogen hydrolase n=1 Tax=Cokeromyces recurvatus TaxID=90255 RepID=UPI00221F4559|nr:carbon-nitrogen hydrolase [Cokeromyces recurvatus]KAI7900761.1 carbon-nitrogen hydrolase [Cokeromyces recurvatus]